MVKAVWRQRRQQRLGTRPRGEDSALRLQPARCLGVLPAIGLSHVERLAWAKGLQFPPEVRQPYLKLRQILLLVNDKRACQSRGMACALGLEVMRFLELPLGQALVLSALVCCEVDLEVLSPGVFCIATTEKAEYFHIFAVNTK